MPEVRIPKTREARVRQEGPDVALLIDGGTVFQAHWKYAKEVGEALLAKARAAEKFELVASGKKPTLRSILGIKFS